MHNVAVMESVDIRVIDDAKSVIELGKRHGDTFVELPFSGTLGESYMTDKWLYVPYEQDRITIPPEGVGRLYYLLQEDVRVSQVIIGHEVDIEEAASQAQGSDEGRWRLTPLAAVGIAAGVVLGAVVIGALTAPAVVPAATAAAVAVPSMTTLGTIGLLSGALLLDPVVILVLEDTGQWVQVYSWVEV